jgi:hypothetical protein
MQDQAKVPGTQQESEPTSELMGSSTPLIFSHTSRRRLRKRVHRITPWALAVCLIMITATLSRGATAVPLTITQASPSCNFALSSQEIASAVDKLSIPSTSQERSSTAGQIGSLYSAMCANLQATALVGEWGAANTSLDLYGLTTGGVVFANFSVNWAIWAGSTKYLVEQYWSMDLGNSAIAGPFTWTSEEKYSLNGAVSYGTYSSDNWAGYEFQGGSNSPEIYGAYANAPVVPMSSEVGQQLDHPPGLFADSAAAVWVGIEDSYGAPNYMVQTGYAYDATNPSDSWCVTFVNSCDYGLWWADLLPHETGTQGAYSGNPTVSVGDTLTPEVYLLNPGYYQMSVWDLTTNTFWDHTIQSPSFTPKAAAFIVETPVMYRDQSGNPFIQQIPGFASNPVNFASGVLCPNPQCYFGVPLSTAYNNGWYQMDQLSQYSGVDNTIQSFSSGSPVVSWSTSEFDFCGIDGALFYQQCTRGGGGCVAYDTPILTPAGYVPVQKLKTGDAIEEYNFSSERLAQGTFLSGNTTNVTRLVDINNGWLYLTPTDQPVYTKNSTFQGWLHDPQNLTISDSIFNPITHTWVHVTSVKLIHDHTVVFDVVTSDANNFVANGALLDRKIG